ncbi:MAG TPA: hypothetical protein VJH34_00485 [archaeon]|nr:hypothetical protein [archaeon]
MLLKEASEHYESGILKGKIVEVETRLGIIYKGSLKDLTYRTPHDEDLINLEDVTRIYPIGRVLNSSIKIYAPDILNIDPVNAKWSEKIKKTKSQESELPSE